MGRIFRRRHYDASVEADVTLSNPRSPQQKSQAPGVFFDRFSAIAALTSGLPLRAVAWLAVAASLFGRMLGPALRGAREGLGSLIAVTDFLAFFSSQAYAFAILATTLSAGGRVAGDRNMTPLGKALILAPATAVGILSAPALIGPLGPIENISVGAASGLVALAAAREGLLVPRTRAIGMVLAGTGVAVLLHLAGLYLAFYAGEHAMYGAAIAARVLATASLAFDLFALLAALTWLSTRARSSDGGPDQQLRWTTRAALLVASIIAFTAIRGASEQASVVEIVSYRALSRLITVPAPYAWVPLRYLLEALAPCLAIVTLITPRQLPIVLSSLALVLLSRPTADVPLCALALTAAGLCTCIAARDERGIWDEIRSAEGRTAQPAEIRLDVDGSGP